MLYFFLFIYLFIYLLFYEVTLLGRLQDNVAG